MSDQFVNYVKLAEDLLTRAGEYDWSVVDSVVDEGYKIRTQILRDFVEKWLEQKISDEEAEKINKITVQPYTLDPQQISPTLEALLKDKL